MVPWARLGNLPLTDASEVTVSIKCCEKHWFNNNNKKLPFSASNLKPKNNLIQKGNQDQKKIDITAV